MKKIAIFASGEGTNAQKIIDYFRNSTNVRPVLIVSNKQDANVLNRAKKENISTLILNKADFYESDTIVETLKKSGIDLIVLAGFLWMIPQNLITAFPNKIVNIHPALLPKFGGKGMYGMNVHKAVIEAREKQSGISIHFVNEQYDEGEIIAQYTCDITENDTPESLAGKIHELEYRYFPKTIEQLFL